MAVGSGDIGAVLQGVGSIAQAIAITYAAYAAANTFKNWREQRLTEKRIEQAERILTAAYNARRHLGFTRNPLITSREQSSAEDQLRQTVGWDELSVEEKESRILAQCYFDRINDAFEVRRSVENCLPMARALFGADVENALETLNSQFHRVALAVEQRVDERDSKVRLEVNAALSSSESESFRNEMNGVIAAQISVLETSLLPVLRLSI